MPYTADFTTWAVTGKSFDEEAHPRVAAGSPQGGQFADAYGAGRSLPGGEHALQGAVENPSHAKAEQKGRNRIDLGIANGTRVVDKDLRGPNAVAEANAEMIASQLDDLLGWNIVPPIKRLSLTKIRTAFVKKTTPDSDIFTGIKPEWDAGSFYKVAVLDALQGQTDRHYKNITITADGRALALDNGGGWGAVRTDKVNPLESGFYNGGGRSFNVWFAGKGIPENILHDLKALRSRLTDHPLMNVISMVGRDKYVAMFKRLDRIVAMRRMLPAGKYESWD